MLILHIEYYTDVWNDNVFAQGHQMKLIYVDPNNPLPDKQYYGSVRLLEVRLVEVPFHKSLADISAYFKAQHQKQSCFKVHFKGCNF